MSILGQKNGIQSVSSIAQEKFPIDKNGGELTDLKLIPEKYRPFTKYVLAQSKQAIEGYLKELPPQEKAKAARNLGEPIFAEPQKVVIQEQTPEGLPIYSIVRDLDIWNVYTNSGRVLEIHVESLEQLDADLRGAYEAVNLNKLGSVIERIDEACTNSKKHEEMLGELTPYEKAVIHALHNTKQILSPAEWDLLKEKIQRGNISIYILPEKDYEIFSQGYYCNKNCWALTLNKPPMIRRGINDYRVIVIIPHPQTKAIIICREAPKYTPSIVTQTSPETIRVNLERRISHELLHVVGIGKHLPGPIEEGVVEYLNILAYKKGEALRKERRDDLTIGYSRIVAIIEIVHERLREMGVPEETIINFMKFGGNQEESETVYNSLIQLFGKEDLNMLLRWEFEDDEQAYEWVKEKLS